MAKSKKKPAAKKVVKKTAAKKSAPKKKAKPAAKKVVKAKASVKTKSKVSAKAKLTKKIAPKKQVASKVATKPAAKPAALVIKPAVKINWNKYLTPLDDRLVVSLASEEKMTAGGLYIPATVTEVKGNLKGEVLAVGRGHQNKKGRVKNMDVQVGDQVLFTEYAGSKIQIEGQTVMILRESDVLGIVTK